MFTLDHYPISLSKYTSSTELLIDRRGKRQIDENSPELKNGLGKVVSETNDSQIKAKSSCATISASYNTSHAVVDAAMTVPLPDNLGFAPATALLVQGLTAYFLLEKGRLKPGGTVLVPSAAGGVGSLAIQIAKLKGAGKVIGLASPSKHQKVRDYGADDVFDYTQRGWAKLVRDATGGKGVDIFLDSQGDRGGEGPRTLGRGAFWLVFGRQAKGGRALGTKRFLSLIFSGVTIRSYWLN